MDYLSCEDVAKSMGTTVRRVQQMCKKGEIEGAVKEGHSWVIPFEDNKSIKELPVGVSDFKIASTNYYYVDNIGNFYCRFCIKSSLYLVN